MAPIAPSPTSPDCTVKALLAELRCLLDHPAIVPERRRRAESFLSQCQDVTRLQHWQHLILQECAAWEDEALAAEEAQAKSLIVTIKCQAFEKQSCFCNRKNKIDKKQL